MDCILKEIKSFLTEACNSFETLKFRVGYGCYNTTYIVEVSPLKEFKENEEYAKMEIDFCDSFEQKHPECTIIFVSEESLSKVKDVIFFIKHNSLEYSSNKKINLNSIFNSWLKNNSKDNYALAA